MGKTDFKNALELIKASNSVAIVGHIRPDGDCVGSSLALKMALVQMGKTVDIYIDGEMSKQFDYLKDVAEIISKFPDEPKEYDLLIILDSSSEDRIGVFTNLRKYAKSTLCIDHHIGTAVQADCVICNSDRASTGEILYELFEQEGSIKIDKDIATALYTSVSTDTGCFLYPSTTTNTHKIAAVLMEHDIDVELIHYNNFRVYDKRLITGFKQVLRNLRFFNKGQISVTCLSMGKSKKDQFDFEERHKLKQYASDARGVVASIFITQEERNVYHVSLRSHGDVNVAIPAQVFGGGGHKNASGFIIKGRYRKIVRQIVKELEKVM